MLPIPPPGLAYVAAPQVVTMDDKPASVLRHKQDSSMGLAIASVVSGAAHACLSAGNTGALMALACHLLGTQEGLERPAICKPIPTFDGVCWMLDLGANLSVTPAMLLQFAHLGNQLVQSPTLKAARVALLNIGVENDKGPESIRQAAALFKEVPDFQYIGFIEASDIFSGRADVVVCDGFAGNIALKASEGTARFLLGKLRELLLQNIALRMLGLVLRPLLRGLYQKFNPSNLNGALLLGLKGIVVKSHGGADIEGFVAALEVAVSQVQQQRAKI